MNFKRKLLAIIVSVFMVVSATACGGNGVGSECTHTWGEWQTKTQATCTQEGAKERKCTLCEETENDKIAMLAHSWVSATCKAPKTCSVCAITEGEPTSHVFNQKVVSSKALKSPANCASPAVYYMSCNCGAVGDSETFTRGTKTDHNFNKQIEKEETIKTPATCIRPALYYFSCECGEVGTDEVFEGQDLLPHAYTKKVVKVEALKTSETATTPAVYYKSCECGEVSQTETFESKNIIVFGDSYSAYHSTLPTDGWYRVYYNGTNILNSEDQMWFNLLCAETGDTLVRNDSSSGSSICYTGYSGGDNSNSFLSFIVRLESLISKGYFTQNRIDAVYVLGGTNDSWSGAPLGEEMYSDWTKKDLYNVLPGICYFYSRIREVLPNAEIYGIANHVNMKQEVIDVIKHATEHVGGNAVLLQDISTTSSHPNAVGMQQICDQILAVMNSEE